MTTTKTQPIICGTDFSEGASQAAVVADALARRLDTPLLLVRSADERGDFPDHMRERLMKDDQPRMTHEAKRLPWLGLTFSCSGRISGKTWSACGTPRSRGAACTMR